MWTPPGQKIPEADRESGTLMVRKETYCVDLSSHFLTKQQEVRPKHRKCCLGESARLEEAWMPVINAAVMEMLLLSSGGFDSLGQGSAWQAWVSLPLPSQSLPPSWGTGALQWRILVICPSPQVTEQEDHGDHKLQPPSWRTGIKKQDRYPKCTDLVQLSSSAFPPT